jgi:ribosomal protein L29
LRRKQKPSMDIKKMSNEEREEKLREMRGNAVEVEE